MSLKHRLLLLAIIVLMTASVLGASVFIFVRQYQEALHKERISSQISFEVYQRRLIGGDYRLYPTERAKAQWFIKQATVEQLVRDNVSSFNSDEEKEFIHKLQLYNAASHENFAELIELADSGQSMNSDKAIAVSSLLSFNSQAAITDATKLQDLNQQKAAAALTRLTILLLVATVGFFALLGTGFWYIWRGAGNLVALNEAKTNFFNNVSHEFRTPLTLILGPLEAGLKRTDLPKEHIKQLEMMHRNTLRLQKLVNNLLEFSKAEAGKINALFKPTDLAVLTRGLASSFASAMNEAKLKFIVDCNPMKQKVYIDPALWETIVLNLLSNALKFTFDGHIKVATKESRNFAELRVEDTGTGVPPAELKHLFERFHRVSGAKSRTVEGSGIGLALVAELVKFHGGTISVDSKIGHGTTFIIRIPFGTSHLPKNQILGGSEEDQQQLSSSVAKAYPKEASGWLRADSTESTNSEEESKLKAVKSRWDETILVVDDNTDMRDFIYQSVSPNVSQKVEMVSSGAEALQKVQQKRPSLIISDVMMPDMDGIEFLRAVRQLPDTIQIPFIFLSARADAKEKISGLAEGVDAYLTKPFSADELVMTVRTKLDLAKARKQSRS